ncbi:hypothetical protein RRG08_031574 [Elysia crispata]|uniref:Uncharacterized protein n=1 Tax=Elysia crispata TaxID=231223 RepID=A0AAE1B434_9GAST|nr:hypothetical protein RRG08_031574 [Elysia crispata]
MLLSTSARSARYLRWWSVRLATRKCGFHSQWWHGILCNQPYPWDTESRLNHRYFEKLRGRRANQSLALCCDHFLTDTSKTLSEPVKFRLPPLLKKRKLLESGKVKVDCCDQQGRTALEMAVTGNDVDVVCYLLERSSGKYIHKWSWACSDSSPTKCTVTVVGIGSLRPRGCLLFLL